jgi:translation initiation factor 2-alpha kinase 4
MRTENKGVLQAKKEEARKVLAKIELEGSRTIEEQERVKRMEEERERQQALSLLPDGVLTQSTITLDREIEFQWGSWQTWKLFDGKPELLWTTYVAEPVVSDDSSDTNLVKTRMPLILPTLWAQVVDFSATHYLGDQGRKKIDSLVSEISHLQTIVSENVLKVYAVKRDRSPKGWERVIIFTERPPGAALLESRLPECGFDCLTAVVGGLLTSPESY